MPDIYALAPDGTYHQFPEGTDPNVVDRAMQAYISSLPDTAPGGGSLAPASGNASAGSLTTLGDNGMAGALAGAARGVQRQTPPAPPTSAIANATSFLTQGTARGVQKPPAAPQTSGIANATSFLTQGANAIQQGGGIPPSPPPKASPPPSAIANATAFLTQGTNAIRQGGGIPPPPPPKAPPPPTKVYDATEPQGMQGGFGIAPTYRNSQTGRRTPLFMPLLDPVQQFKMDWLNTLNEDANDPMRAAVALAKNPNDPEWTRRLALMNPISQQAILEKAQDLRSQPVYDPQPPNMYGGFGQPPIYRDPQTGEQTAIPLPHEIIGTMLHGPEGYKQLQTAQGALPELTRIAEGALDPQNLLLMLGTAGLGATGELGQAAVKLGVGGMMGYNAVQKARQGDYGGASVDALLGGLPFAHDVAKAGSRILDPAFATDPYMWEKLGRNAAGRAPADPPAFRNLLPPGDPNTIEAEWRPYEPARSGSGSAGPGAGRTPLLEGSQAPFEDPDIIEGELRPYNPYKRGSGYLESGAGRASLLLPGGPDLPLLPPPPAEAGFVGDVYGGSAPQTGGALVPFVDGQGRIALPGEATGGALRVAAGAADGVAGVPWWSSLVRAPALGGAAPGGAGEGSTGVSAPGTGLPTPAQGVLQRGAQEGSAAQGGTGSALVPARSSAVVPNGLGQIGSGQISSGQVDPGQVGLGQAGPGQIGWSFPWTDTADGGAGETPGNAAPPARRSTQGPTVAGGGLEGSRNAPAAPTPRWTVATAPAPAWDGGGLFDFPSWDAPSTALTVPDATGRSLTIPDATGRSLTVPNATGRALVGPAAFRQPGFSFDGSAGGYTGNAPGESGPATAPGAPAEAAGRGLAPFLQGLGNGSGILSLEGGAPYGQQAGWVAERGGEKGSHTAFGTTERKPGTPGRNPQGEGADRSGGLSYWPARSGAERGEGRYTPHQLRAYAAGKRPLGNRARLDGTEAEGRLSPLLWSKYKFGVGKNQWKQLGPVRDAFEGSQLAAIRAEIPDEVLDTPLTIAPDLSAYSEPGYIYLAIAFEGLAPDGSLSRQIWLNGAYREDPAHLLLTLLEETWHIYQLWRGDKFDDTLPYEQRPHEIEAKAFAHRVGYPPVGRPYVPVGWHPSLLPPKKGVPSLGALPNKSILSVGGTHHGQQPNARPAQTRPAGSREGAELTPAQRKRTYLANARRNDPTGSALEPSGVQPGYGAARTGSDGGTASTGRGPGSRDLAATWNPTRDAFEREENRIEGTAAEQILQADFHARKDAALGRAKGKQIGTLADVFQGKAEKRFQKEIRKAGADPSLVAQTPIYVWPFGQGLRGVVAYVTKDARSPNGYAVRINVNMREVPNNFAFTMAEEAAHVIQCLTDYPFDFSQEYEQRPHEIDAKATAARIVGYKKPPDTGVLYVPTNKRVRGAQDLQKPDLSDRAPVEIDPFDFDSLEARRDRRLEARSDDGDTPNSGKLGVGGAQHGQQSNARPTQESTAGSRESAELTPAQRKRARLATVRGSGGRSGNGPALGTVGDGTAHPGGVSVRGAGSGSVGRSTEKGPNGDTDSCRPTAQPDTGTDRRPQAEIPGGDGGGKVEDLALPRVAMRGTEAEGHLSPEWYDEWRRYVIDGSPVSRWVLKDVLQGETLRRAWRAFRKTPEVMESPVEVVEYLHDYVGGTIRPRPSSPSGYCVALNGRMIFDPTDILQMIGEEAMHIARKLKGRAFDFSKPYHEQPHEISAKKGSRYVTGFAPERYQMIREREIGQLDWERGGKYLQERERRKAAKKPKPNDK